MLPQRIITGFGFIFLVACNSNVREGSIGSLAGQSIPVEETRATQLVVDDDVMVADYGRYIRLFDTFSSEPMRRDGMRRMASLQRDHKGADSVPLDKVISMFEQLIEDHPLEKHDRLMYQLSREYEENGDLAAALTSLDRLVSRYKESRYFDEAQFRRGELLFSKRRYLESEQAYKAVIDFRQYDDRSIYYEQAVYKQGWSQFKLSRYKDAINSFMHLLDLHAHDGDLKLEQMKKSEREFVDDTIRAINLSFSYQAGPVSAAEYFATQSRRVYEYRLFDSLAKFYLQKKHYADAVKTYQLFVSANEMHSESPSFLINVINVFDEGGFPDQLLDAKKDYVQRYPAQSPFWRLYEARAHEAEYDALRMNIRELASYYHSLAQAQRSTLHYREAQRWYRTWLDGFANHPTAWNVNFLFAELLNESQQYEKAMLQYERTAYDYPQHSKSADAGYAALLMYEQHEKSLQGFAKQQWHRQSIDSAIRFANNFDSHKQADAVMTQALENLFKLGEYEKAYQIARQVAGDIKQPALLASVWTVIAHIEFEWSDFRNAEASYGKALQYAGKEHAEHKLLTERKALAVYKQGEISRNKGDLDAAVKHFSRVKQVSAETGLVASAEFDAAAALIGLRNWAKAATVLETFRRQNPQHKLQPEVTRKLAVVYLEKGDIEKASIEFEKVSALAGDRSYQLESLWQSAELAEQVAKSERAQTLYKQFVKRFPQPLERSIEARQRIIELYDRDNKSKQATYWRKQLIAADAAAGAGRTERSRYLAARASFALAEPVFDAYRKVKLSVPLKNSLKKKRARMDQALKVYGQAASYKVPEVLTAATFRIAEIYQDLGLAIYNSERPTTLNEEELEQYDILLEEQAYPFEEKAIEFHEVNMSRLADGLDVVWIWKSLEQLKELLPVRYNKQERTDAIVKEIF